MKTKFLLLVAALVLVTGSIQAKGFIVYGVGPEVSKVKDLPNEPDFEIYDNKGNAYHADLGVMYKQFSLFWIPIWNYGTTKYVLYTEKTKTSDYDFYYVDLDEDDLDYLRIVYDIDIPAKPQLSFWNQVGGKILILFIIALIAWYCIFFKNNDEQISDYEEQTDKLEENNTTINQ